MASKAEYIFDGLTDMELIMLQHKARRFPEDKPFVEAILIELGNRTKAETKGE